MCFAKAWKAYKNWSGQVKQFKLMLWNVLKKRCFKISMKTCMVEAALIQVCSWRSRTLLKTDSITDIFLQIFWNYSQLLPCRGNNCDQLLVKLPCSLPVNTSPANIYLFKVNNRNTRKRCEIFSKLTIKTPERRRWRRSGVFIINFENISHLFLELLLLTLNK